jgi:hypothetical protein
MAKEKGQKDKQRATKHTYKTKDRVIPTTLKIGDEIRCSERVCSTCRKHVLVLSSFMIYHRFVTRLTRHVPLVEWELLSLSEHLISSPIFSGVGITRSLVLYVCFVARCLSFCPFH